jgi:hypothetical protein
MADDLKRFLEDRPIKARRTTVRERLWRWCRRNPMLAGLTAAVAALLLFLAVGSTLAAFHFQRLANQEKQAHDEAEKAHQSEAEQRRLAEEATQREAEQRRAAEDAHQEAEVRRAEAERHHRQSEAHFAKARSAVDDYFTRVSESQLLDVPGMQPLRGDLLTSALRFYQDFLQQRRDDASLQAALAATQLRIGRIYNDLGEADKGRTYFKDAQTLGRCTQFAGRAAIQHPQRCSRLAKPLAGSQAPHRAGGEKSQRPHRADQPRLDPQ